MNRKSIMTPKIIVVPVDVNAINVELLDESIEHLLNSIHRGLRVVVLLWRQHLSGVDTSCIPANTRHCVYVRSLRGGKESRCQEGDGSD